MTLSPPIPTAPHAWRLLAETTALPLALGLIVTAFSSLPALASSRLVPPVERHLDELRQAGEPGDDPVYTNLPALPIAGGEDAAWLPAFGPPTIGNTVLAAVVLPDSTLIVGGDFVDANEEPLFHVARWADFEWAPLGDGLDGSVYALAAWSGQIVAGGIFQTSIQDTTALRYVALWNGSEWKPMGDGFDASVLALREVEGTLYAAGWFEKSGTTELNHVARWDEGSSSWQPLGTGLLGGPSPRVNALGEWSGQLVVGGRFERSADGNARSLATWNGSTWEEFAGGAGDRIYTIEPFGDELFVGGLFAEIGGIQARHLARWDGTSWSSVDTGTNEAVVTLAEHDGALFAGGLFTIAGSGTAISVARYDPVTERLSSTASGMNGGVTQLVPWSGRLLATGIFTQAGGGNVSYVASLGDDGWGPIGAALDGPVHALQPFGERLVVGGEFSRAGRDAANIAAWDGRHWSTLGAGLDGPVDALGVFGGDLYAGGSFALTDSTRGYLVRWNEETESWSDFGGVTGRVYAILAWGDSLLVGGDLTSVNGMSVRRIALFDGETWSPLGNGFDRTVRALGGYGGEFVAGGDFAFADLNHIGHFDGTTWQPFGSGTNGIVRVIGRFRGNGGPRELLIGGDFTEADSSAVGFLAIWRDSTWAGMETHIVGPSVETFISTGASLYLAGSCTVPTSGGGTAHHIARADQAYQWSALGSGLNGRARALAVFQDLLYVGGDFSAAGGKSSPYLARWEDLGPVPVQLAHLDGRRENGEVILRWFVSESLDHAGFYVYRDETSPSARITSELLFAADGLYELHDPTAPGGETSYWIEEISTDGVSSWFGPVVVGPGPVGSGDRETAVLTALGPLPFGKTTGFRLRTSVGAEVSAEIFDVRGRVVRTLWRGRVDTEDTLLEWNGRNDAGESVSSALYFLRVNGPGWRHTLRILRIE